MTPDICAPAHTPTPRPRSRLTPPKEGRVMADKLKPMGIDWRAHLRDVHGI